MMSMESAIEQIQSGEEGVLVAIPPLTWGAEAKIIQLTDDYHVPSEYLEAGYKYVLGTDDVKTLLDFVLQKRMSSKSIAELIIHYAETDSYPEWLSDIPNR